MEQILLVDGFCGGLWATMAFPCSCGGEAPAGCRIRLLLTDENALMPEQPEAMATAIAAFARSLQ